MKLGRYKNKVLRVYNSIVFNWFFPDNISSDKSIIDNLNYILRDDYFDSVSISNIKESRNRKIIKNMIETSHIDIDYVAAFPIYFENLNPSSIDESQRRKTVDRLKECIDEAYYFNARTFLIISGDDPGKDKRKLAKENLITSLNELCDYCYGKSKDYVLKITLEHGDRDLVKKYLLGPSKEIAEVLQMVKEHYNNLGVTIDLAHIYLSTEKLEEYLLNLKDFIEDVHINNCIMKNKDNPLYGDKHVLFGINESEIDTKEVINFLRILKDLGFFYRERPIVAFEVTPVPGQDINTVIASIKRVFNESWSRIQEY